MTDNEKRAHDFAVAAVESYQKTQTDWAVSREYMPKFDISELTDVYLDAYEQMSEKLEEEEE